MSKQFVTGCLIIILSSTLLRAQDSLRQEFSLDEIVLSASKVPLERKQSAKPVRVISAEQIQRSEGKDLAQVLNEEAGIIINGAYSNPGKNRDVFLRGASGSYTLVLVDGVPFTDASGLGGVFDIRMIPLAQIERIEILKGSQSTLYGSDAIAGVINIITKQASDKPVSLNGAISLGSFETLEAQLGVSGSVNELLDYSVNYSHFSTEGVSEAEDNVDTLSFDLDGSERNAIQAKLAFTPVSGLRIEPFLRYTDFEGDYDNGAFADGANTFTSEILNPGVNAGFRNENFDIQLLYQFLRTDRSFNSSFGESIFEGRTHTSDLFASYSFNEFLQLLGGVYYQSAQMLDENATEPDPDFTITSPYISLLIKEFDGINGELGYRFNEHSEFGSASTYSAALSYSLTSRLSLFGSYTTGFKSPVLSQLFGQFGPNPDLQPEKSQTFEAGLRWQDNTNKLFAQATFFERSIEDVIIFDFSTGYQNQDEQDDYGVEVEMSYQILPQLTFRGNYNFVDGELTTLLTQEQDTSFNNLIRRPKHSFVLGLEYEPLPYLFVSLQGQYYGERSDRFFDSNTFETVGVDLDPYFLLNAYAEARLLKRKIIVFVDAKNLTDTDFVESTGFTTLGINVQGGVRFNL